MRIDEVVSEEQESLRRQAQGRHELQPGEETTTFPTEG